jgi:hypothetical protein
MSKAKALDTTACDDPPAALPFTTANVASLTVVEAFQKFIIGDAEVQEIGVSLPNCSPARSSLADTELSFLKSLINKGCLPGFHGGFGWPIDLTTDELISMFGSGAVLVGATPPLPSVLVRRAVEIIVDRWHRLMGFCRQRELVAFGTYNGARVALDPSEWRRPRTAVDVQVGDFGDYNGAIGGGKLVAVQWHNLVFELPRAALAIASDTAMPPLIHRVACHVEAGMSEQAPFTDSQPLKRTADDIASLGFAANETERSVSRMSASVTSAASGIAQSHTLASTQTQRILAEMRAADEMRAAEATQRIVAEMRVADEMRAAEATRRIVAEMRAAMTHRYTAGVVENPPLKLLRSPIEAAKKELLRDFRLLLMESVATLVSSPTPENTTPSAPDETTEHRQLPSIAKAESQCRAWLIEQMRASPHERPMAKEGHLRAAVDKYPGLSERGFERAWARAIEETEARWNLAGRPKKSPQ